MHSLTHRSVTTALTLAALLSLCTPAAAAAQVVTLPTVRTRTLVDERRLALVVASLRVKDSFDAGKPCSSALTDWIVQASMTRKELNDYYAILRLAKTSVGGPGIVEMSTYRPDTTIERLHLGSLARLYLCPNTFVKEAVDDPTIKPRTVSLSDIDQLVGQAHVTMPANDARLAKIDSLATIARTLVVRRNVENTWFPVKNRLQAMEFWKQTGFSTLNVAAISLSQEKGAAYTELASPILHAVRLSVNAVISGGEPASDPNATAAPALVPQTDKETINRFLTGGGVINVSAAWPFMHAGTETQSIDFTTLLAPRIGGTLPALGSTKRDTSAVADLGLEFHLKSVDISDGVGLFVQSRLSETLASPKFAELIGAPDTKSFRYMTLGGGLLLGGKYLLMAQRVISGPGALQSLGWQVSVTAMRSAADVISDPK